MRVFLLGNKDMIQYLTLKGWEGVHVHKLRPEDCKGATVVGNIPLHVAYQADQIFKVLMPDMTPVPKEMGLERMLKTDLVIAEFSVKLINTKL